MTGPLRKRCGIDLACDGERVNLNLLLKDYAVREDVEPLPTLTVRLRRWG